jgi:hypothetical protein
MGDIGVANSMLTFTGETRPFDTGGKSGLAEIVTISTPDGLKGEVSIQKFADGDIHVRLTEFLATPPPIYSHLSRNGTMTVQVREDGKWVALVRALRPGGREHATLNSINWAELDDLLGEGAKLWLQGHGFEVGTWAALNPRAAKFKDSIAVAIESESAHLLALPWTLTRVIALMKKLGKPSVIELG